MHDKYQTYYWLVKNWHDIDKKFTIMIYSEEIDLYYTETKYPDFIKVCLYVTFCVSVIAPIIKCVFYCD